MILVKMRGWMLTTVRGVKKYGSVTWSLWNLRWRLGAMRRMPLRRSVQNSSLRGRMMACGTQMTAAREVPGRQAAYATVLMGRMSTTESRADTISLCASAGGW